MAIKLIAPGEYANAIKILRKYADGFEASDSANFDLRKFHNTFKNPLTKSQRAKVAKYYDVYQRHAAYKNSKYQFFRGDKKLQSAQKAMGMPSKGSWRGVFVPEPTDKAPAHLIKRGGKWIIEYEFMGVDTVFVPFDREAFANLGIEYVRSLFARVPAKVMATYRFNLDMGYGRNRWKAGGNFEQMLRDLDFIVGDYTKEKGKNDYYDFIMGVHVYRATLAQFNTLKREQAKTMTARRLEQSEFKKLVARERRKIRDRDLEMEYAARLVRDGDMAVEAFNRRYGL